MVAVLVILDGASEPLGVEPTSLERARTPVLDALAAEGALSRVRTVAPWLPAGSESAIPALLGWTPPAPVDRGAVEAAAHEIALAPGERAWRVDVLDASSDRAGAAAVGRADEPSVEHAAHALRAALAPRHTVHRLAGHRLLLTGPPPLPAAATEPLAADRALPADSSPLVAAAHASPTESLAARRVILRPWPEGVTPPRILDRAITVIAARGAAAGLARLMGARVIVPAGATGRPDTDLSAKAAAAIAAIERGAARVVVHVGGPDEAAHERDVAAKVAAIERIDGELLAPLAAAVRRAGGTLRVCPDHGCDPRTGAHDAEPVPCLDWPGAGTGAGRLTERAVAVLPVLDLTTAPAAPATRPEAA